ncbi:alpha/beta fold hydrolase [Marinobacter zhejiangensis]|uniref:Serine aminopeptidase, S33 n=1 Tax=Marinobacter zhejiangensis TaxID=488535 RepID=A0A1I4RPG2_9GAMM|nr:alpha/beta fold hydrolase [Marinobacter zhejiangensis]SFM53880.1 Serine aminopeptidase, S33 [Marinobacter zhejiangensis]
MEAFYFGPSESYLFGVFHPRRGTNRNEAVVLCNPFGQEYLRAHKSIRRLAISLADLGYSVIRFDYRGSGDSAGDLTNISADQWVDDIRHAIQEALDMTAAPKAALVGLRLGALLAARAATGNPKVSRLVMWDPVLDGAVYVDGIRSSIVEAQARGSRSRLTSPDGTLHFNGFCMPPKFQDSLNGATLQDIVTEIRVPIAQITSHETDGFSQLQQQLAGQPGFHATLAPAPHDWNYVDHVGGILWPKPVIDAIEHYFSQPAH